MTPKRVAAEAILNDVPQGEEGIRSDREPVNRQAESRVFKLSTGVVHEQDAQALVSGRIEMTPKSVWRSSNRSEYRFEEPSRMSKLQLGIAVFPVTTRRVRNG
jgi:hypothetical protein